MPTGMVPSQRDTCIDGTFMGKPIKIPHEPWTKAACCARCGVKLRKVD